MVVRRTTGSTAEAQALVDAVRADTPAYVELSVDGPSLRIRVAAASAASARATLEDLFACLKAAERTAGLVGGPKGAK